MITDDKNDKEESTTDVRVRLYSKDMHDFEALQAQKEALEKDHEESLKK